MNMTTASIPATILASESVSEPRGEALLKRFIQSWGLVAATALLALYIPNLEPKLMIVVCLAAGLTVWRHLLDRDVWPLVALCFYMTAMSALVSNSQPGKLDVLEDPGYQLMGVLLVWATLRHSGITAALVVVYACIAVSLVGVAGELAGYDMTNILPISLPNDEFFDAITTTASGEGRVRGFFPEASILGAISVSFSFVAAAASFILARRRNSVASYLGALVSVGFLLFFLGITLAKTGMVMFALGMFGFAAVNFWFGTTVARLRTVVVLGVLAAGAVLLFMSDTTLGGYLREEVEGLPIPHSGAAWGKAGAGAATRLTSWKLAWVNLKAHPFGVGHFGLGSTVSAGTGITPTPEMVFWFQRNNFSLKCAMANIVAETGFVGMGLLGFWIFANFVSPAFAWVKRFGNESLGVPGLYAACLLISLGLLMTCELYPYLAFALLLKLVADRVASSVLKSEAGE